MRKIGLLAIAGVGLTACVPNKPDTNAPPNYQAPVTNLAPPANLSAICYDDADLSVFRVRMVQQEIVVGVLECKNADGNLALDVKYADFVRKFGPELSSNSASLTDVASRRHANVDVMVTAIANLTANQSSTDGAFCSRHQRALEWSLQPQVTSLAQVPSPYDLGPDMTIFPCPH